MTASRPRLPDPSTAPELFEGVLLRRVFAWCIDTLILAAITCVLGIVGLVIGILTLGLGLLAIPFILPLAILIYYAATLGSPMRATIGMSAMDIVLTPARGAPLDGWRILAHPLIFWVTVWIAWPVSLAVAFFTPRREMVQDILTGTLMVRRSPMIRHWRAVRS